MNMILVFASNTDMDQRLQPGFHGIIYQQECIDMFSSRYQVCVCVYSDGYIVYL